MSRYNNNKRFGKNWRYIPGKAGHYQFSSHSAWEKQATARGLSVDDAYDVQRDFGGDIRQAQKDLEK
jgi:hypothetical protein